MRRITAVEVIITYISLGWAYVMFTVPGIFNLSAHFNLIHEIARKPEIIGSVALFAAIVKIVGMVLQMNRVRWFGLVLSGILWTFVATAMLVATGEIVFSTGFIAYSGIAILCLWSSKEVTSSDRPNE